MRRIVVIASAFALAVALGLPALAEKTARPAAPAPSTGQDIGPSPAEGRIILRSADEIMDAPTEAILLLQARYIFGHLPERMPGAEKDTPELIDLGRRLYLEVGMSANESQSCNSCHPVDGRFAGADNEPTSSGATRKLGKRNSPTTLNAGFQIGQFWDGRAKSLAAQAVGPILNPVEMGMSDPEAVMERLHGAAYRERFTAAFPGEKNAFTYEMVGRAIAAFERTLVSRGRYDRYAEGDGQALDPLEKRGLAEFVNAGCVRCHNGPTFGGLMYQKIGLYRPYGNKEDKGRFEATGRREDLYVFKVPLLRNATLTGPYFHDGQVSTLAEAIDLMGRLQLGAELNNAQVDVLMRFLTTLADEKRTSSEPTGSKPPAKPWNPPAMSELPSDKAQAELVRRGYDLLSDTSRILGRDGKGLTRSALSCRNCHQEAGSVVYGLPWMGAGKRYPRHRAREGRVESLVERINSCMERSLNGQALPVDGPEMRAMLAYIDWLSERTPKEDAGLLAVDFQPPAREADIEKGEKAYTLYCQNCHGDNGQGYRLGGKGLQATPPLWGAESYNLGAGMARLLTAAAFVRANMPLGTRWDRPVLSAEEAYDAAAFVNAHDRPDMKGLEKDYPDKLSKPVDAPYGPYADPFPPEQHRVGPFKPIQDWYKAHGKG